MVDKHSQSFFGQKVGLTVQSASRTQPHIFIKCIKKKPDGSWEKPSQGEGKTIKFQLDEIIMILEVLNRNSDSWSSYHSFKEVKTQISVKWEDPEKKKKLLINIDKYFKMFNFAQTELLRLLLEHFLEEKIEFATVMNAFEKKKNTPSRTGDNPTPKKDISPVVKKTIERSSSIGEIDGTIESETEKALLIQFNGDKGIWIPKSCIHSEFEPIKDSTQTFAIEDWILKKNNVVQT